MPGTCADVFLVVFERGIQMKWNVGRAGLRAIGAALVGFFAILFATATPSAAASYTLNFTGTATAATGFFSAVGVTSGDPVSGSITFDPFNDSSYTLPLPWLNEFAQSASSFTFHVNHAGGLDFTNTDTGSGNVQSLDRRPTTGANGRQRGDQP
jgi:hypothetical protein